MDNETYEECEDMWEYSEQPTPDLENMINEIGLATIRAEIEDLNYKFNWQEYEEAQKRKIHLEWILKRAADAELYKEYLEEKRRRNATRSLV
jgi:hypothetical protein